MAKQNLTGFDILALPSLTTPKAGSVGFGAKSDGLYQKIGTVESKLSTTAELLDRVKTPVPSGAKFTDTNTTYGAVTTSANGLMIAADKVKLNGIATGANNYVHPTAHPISFITGLQSALDGKSATGHTHTFVSLTNKPTTLSGFGITDAYTKAEVNSLANYVGRYSSTNGFLVKTDVARNENSMLVLHIKGNSYGGRVPINTFVQVYNYVTSDAIIHTGALNNGYRIDEVKVFYYDNLVYFWVPQQTSHMTMTFQLLKKEEQVNRVASVSNSVVPTTGVEKMVTITPRTAWFEDTLTNLSQLTDNIGVGGHIANKANPHAITKVQVGLSNVDNTSDLLKPISSAVQTALNLKANLASPTFTGNVTAPTFIGALTGNASSAAKLQTARTIAGVSFDGTANIDIPFNNLVSRPTTLSGYGITDAEVDSLIVNDEAFMYGDLTMAGGTINANDVDFGNGFTIGSSGTELVFKYNGVIKQRMLSDGTILGTGGITALST